jgi:hypothetical protein
LHITSIDENKGRRKKEAVHGDFEGSRDIRKPTTSLSFFLLLCLKSSLNENGTDI